MPDWRSRCQFLLKWISKKSVKNTWLTWLLIIVSCGNGRELDLSDISEGLVHVTFDEVR